MDTRKWLRLFRRHRAASVAVGAALALLIVSLLSVTVRADENHGDSAHNVSLSCPGTVDEGSTATVTLTRASNATKPIKGTVRTDPYFALADDFDHGSTTVNHNGNSTEVEIDTTQDTRIEGDESFKVKWINDHNNSVYSCLILILDDDDVEVESLEVTSTPESGDVYGLRETIEITMTVDRNVDASSSAYVSLEISSPSFSCGSGLYSVCNRRARYSSGSGTDTIVYAYTVQRYDLDTNGLSITGRDKILGLPGLTYAGTSTAVSIGGYNRQGNLSAHKIDGLPRITDIEITSEPDDGDAYRFREQIVFEVTLDAWVKVYGAPGLKITLSDSVSGDRPDNTATSGTQVGAASRARWAAYDAALTLEANVSDDYGPTVIFVYDVGPTDKSSDGVAVPENDTDDRTQFVIPGSTPLLDEDGDEIEDRFEVLHDFNRWAQLTHQTHYDHEGLAADSDHAVDGTEPLIEIDFGTVNNALGATLTFWNIPNDDGDLTWRADVTSDGEDKDSCEGTNMGADQTVDEDDIPDLGESLERTVNLASGCVAGSYSIDVVATVDGEDIAEASMSFQVNLSWSSSE